MTLAVSIVVVAVSVADRHVSKQISEVRYWKNCSDTLEDTDSTIDRSDDSHSSLMTPIERENFSVDRPS